MTKQRALKLAREWEQGHKCTLRDGEAAEYHSMFAAMLEESMPNEPLMLEQLLEMVGKPVYIIANDMGIAEWNVIAGKEWITIAYDVPRNGFKAVVEGVGFINGRAFRIDSYGTDWFAYRRQPEGEA